jgi:hypothetical protein
VSWLYIALLACAVVVLVGAEWPQLQRRFGGEGRRRRERSRRKASLKLLRTESDGPRGESEEVAASVERDLSNFAASVERDLSNLPTIEEREGNGRGRS